MTTQNYKLGQDSKTQIAKKNSKIQIVTKLKNSICDETQNTNCDKLKNSNCDKTKKN